VLLSPPNAPAILLSGDCVLPAEWPVAYLDDHPAYTAGKSLNRTMGLNVLAKFWLPKSWLPKFYLRQISSTQE